uniref:Uncharacterized protein n=1 Tax=Setaria viridis TaxID=4556 RepID=A0A4U6UQZ4_SETVI|nr:hypothetical protein SEVIR_5G410750v2 [Setaria viridis]
MIPRLVYAAYPAIRPINVWLSGALARDQCAGAMGQSRAVTPSTQAGFDISSAPTCRSAFSVGPNKLRAVGD